MLAWTRVNELPNELFEYCPFFLYFKLHGSLELGRNAKNIQKQSFISSTLQFLLWNQSWQSNYSVLRISHTTGLTSQYYSNWMLSKVKKNKSWEVCLIPSNNVSDWILFKYSTETSLSWDQVIEHLHQLSVCLLFKSCISWIMWFWWLLWLCFGYCKYTTDSLCCLAALPQSRTG